MTGNGTILLTNDDGLGSRGLTALAVALTDTFGPRVVVVAPDSERSAVGCGVTLRRPVHVQRTELPDLPGTPAYAVSGTPVDCVKLGVRELVPGPVALICSGVNHGANLGTDVFYSGTVSAAIEAILLGLPGLAVSVGPPGRQGFATASEIAVRLAGTILRQGLPERTLLNVNVPETARSADLAGLRITRLGRRSYQNHYRRERVSDGQHLYELAGETLCDHDEAGTDIEAIRQGLVSITPLHLDLTNHAALPAMKEWLR